MSYLLDTSVLIGWFRNKPEESEFIESNKESTMYISAITYGEFYEGTIVGGRQTSRKRRSDEILNMVDIIPVDVAIARRFAELRAVLRSRGELFGDLDILIAATALEHGLELVTSNMRHFGRLSELRAAMP